MVKEERGLILLITESLLTVANLSLKLGAKGYKVVSNTPEDKGDVASIINEAQPDLIIAGYNLRQVSGIEVLKIARINCPHIPVIFYDDQIGESRALETIRNGAFDFVHREDKKAIFIAVEKVFAKTLSKRKRTGTKKAKLSLQKREAFYRGILYHSYDGISIIDAEGNIIYQAPSNVRITGYNARERIGEGIYSKIFPADVDKVKKAFQSILQHPEKSVNLLIRVKHKNGHYIFLENHAINLLHDKVIKGIVINFRDVTERIVAENEVKLYANLQAELATFGKVAFSVKSIAETFQAAVRTLSLMLSTDLCHIMRYIPERKGFMLEAGQGWPESEIDSNFCPLDTQTLAGSAFMQSKFLMTEDITKEEFLLLKDPINMGLKSAMCTVIRSGKNKYGVICAYFKEPRKISLHEQSFLNTMANILSEAITRIVNESELKELNDELIKRNEDLENFAYVASHNLRAPLTNIAGLLDLYKLNESVGFKNKMINHIDACVKLLDNTLIQIIGSISEKKSKQIFHKVNLEHTLSRVLQSIQDQLKEKNAQVVSDFTEMPEIVYPLIHIQSIFQNTITNAVKYSKPEVRPVINIFIKPFDDLIRLSIKDNGQGIDLNRYQNRLFRMYQRFHDPEGKEGTGLGLYIIKSQVESLGGKIEIESKVGEGTTFHFYFKPRIMK